MYSCLINILLICPEQNAHFIQRMYATPWENPIRSNSCAPIQSQNGWQMTHLWPLVQTVGAEFGSGPSHLVSRWLRRETISHLELKILHNAKWVGNDRGHDRWSDGMTINNHNQCSHMINNYRILTAIKPINHCQPLLAVISMNSLYQIIIHLQLWSWLDLSS